jgi:integrase
MTKQPWNKNKSVGQKKGFSPMQIKALRKKLKENDLILDLALFNTGIDTLLRASDLLKLKVEDVIDWKEKVKETINLKQKKTSQSHQVILSPQTKESIEALIKKEGKFENHYLFSSPKYGKEKPMSDDFYRNLVKKWAKMLDLDPRDYSTHSLRRSMAVIIYKEEKDLEVVRRLLGQKSIESTRAYLGIDHEEALETRKRFMI